MPNHFIEAPDDTIRTSNEMVSRDDLTTMYPTVQKEELGPWMGEQERQAKLEAQRLRAIAQIRRYSALIGFLISLPFVMSILVFQALTIIVPATKGEPSLAILAGFGGILMGLVFVGLTIAFLKKVSSVFSEHALKAAPITLTILISLLLISQPLADLAQQLIGGWPGYATFLFALPVVSMVMATVLLFVWTVQKIPALVKLLILPITIAAAALVMYLSI